MSDKPITKTGNSDKVFNIDQPWVVTMAPEANDVNANTVNVMKLMAPCARSFSTGW